MFDMDPLIVSGVLASFVFGGSFAFSALSGYLDRKQRNLVKSANGEVDVARPLFQSQGVSSAVLSFAIRQCESSQSAGKRTKIPTVFKLGSSAFASKGRLAGVASRIDEEGLCKARLFACAYSVMLCLATGLAISPQVAVAGIFAGFFMGWTSISWALGREALARKQMLEGHLSELIEVVCLGLRSGLSFDFALRLYCQCFEGVLASELSLAMSSWQAGLKSRDQALRDVASTYDSTIFSRVVESIVRSMRFGSPLAESLEVLAVEARQSHKAQVEERVMKAPVKMMLPVGTLILPSMLILVLGPVLLDLAQGF